MTIPTPPTAPNRTDPINFRERMDAFLAWMVEAVPEMNALALVTNSSLWADGSAGTPGMRWASDTNTGFFRPGADTIGFAVGGAEAMRINSAGALYIGSPTSVTGIGAAGLQLEGVGSASGITSARFSANSTGPTFAFAKSRAGTIDVYTLVNAADQLGVLEFNGADGTTMVVGAKMLAYVIGTPAAGDIRAGIRFQTASAAAGVQTTRFQMDDTSVVSYLPFGYGSGVAAGGTVTQATSKATAVTLDRANGRITTNAAALAAATSVEFTLNDSVIAIEDHIVLTVQSPVSKYLATVVGKTAGTCIIRLTNYTAGSLSEAVIINFEVHKGSLN